ncbi:MAG TPA: winged helix-turn-helix transcriptional regulator [Thermoplasmatales archaeon]|nr:winged helix-turn-helix transcriptional regulator [Thermoplasmatales archaeon]
MNVLREKSTLTKTLILIQIIKNKPSKLSHIANALGITIQAVSHYIKKLMEENLVAYVNERYVATNEGVEYVQSKLLGLKRFVDEEIENLNVINVCTAIAKEKIKKGDRVNLFMEDGYLVAYKNKPSPSKGTALRDAHPNEDLPVTGLQGIIKHKLGKLTVVVNRCSKEGGSRDIDKKKVKSIINRNCCKKIAVADVVSLCVLRDLDIDIDIEFAPVEAALDAVRRGISVCFFGNREDGDKLLSVVTKFNRQSQYRIEYEIVEI